MNINKKILLLFIVYIVAIVGFAGYKVSKGGETYYSYKSEVKKAKAQLDSESKEDKDKEQITTENSSIDKNKNSEKTAEAAKPTVNNADTKKEEDYSSVKFTKQLAQNAKGDDVKKLQYLLKKKDCYTGEITGTFDAATKQALVKFQKNNSIPSDGILGSATWTKLEQ